MRIQIDPHTLQRAKERGAREEEIEDVIHTGSPIPGKHGRKGKTRPYSFDRKRHGKHYDEKRIEVFYIEEKDGIITVTVYVFYGKWS